MSKHGTWADNVIIHGVGDSLNLKIFIVESDPNFADFNIIEATISEQQCVTVYIGHVDEVRYVSTKKLISNANVQQTGENYNNILDLDQRMHDIGACNYYEIRKSPKALREVRKMLAVCCMESCKDLAESLRKQNVNR